MRRLIIAALLLLLPRLAAADGLAGLESQLAGVDSLRGRFAQTLVSGSGEILEQSSGSFSLLRPGYLSWHILEPEEQLLLAANETLWHYDVELETATRRRIPVGHPTSPLTILGGDTATLSNWYEVEQLSEGRWRLRPRFDDAEFSAVELGFVDGLPVEMKIIDNLGRTTLIALQSLEPGSELSPSDFLFEPPPGIDIYASDEP